MLDMTKSMLKEKNLPKKLWGETIATSTYVLNRCPTFLEWIVPKMGVFQLCFKRVPQVKGLHQKTVYAILVRVTITFSLTIFLMVSKLFLKISKSLEE